jgi:hypothetical protein
MMKRQFILSLIISGSLALLPEPAHAGDYGRERLRLDFTLLDFPFNTDRHYGFPSMAQSLGVTKSVYSAAHYGIQGSLGNDHPFLASLGIVLADSALEFLPFGDGWLHEEWHRAVLKNHGIRSHNDIYKVRMADAVAVSHVKDNDLITLKREHPADLVRLHAAGIEGQNQLVLALQKDNFFYGTNLWNAPLYWFVHFNTLAYIRLSGRPRADKETDEQNREEGAVSRRDFTGLDFTAWVYDLHRPKEAYEARGAHPSGVGLDRYIKHSDLTEPEKRYLKRQGRLSYLNFIDPQLLGIDVIRMKRPRGEDPVRFNANLKHTLTSFGYVVDANIFFRQAETNVFLTLHNYYNKDAWFPGLDFTYFRTLPQDEDGWNTATRLALWMQPEGQKFAAEKRDPGGLLALRFIYESSTRVQPFIEFEGKTRGWVAGNVYLDPAVSARLGFSWF